MWGTNRTRRHGHQSQHRRSDNNRYGYRTELIDVPTKACGLIVGKAGRNIKELQQMDGIKHIRVDFQLGSVKIIGDEAGIAAAKHRIDQAVVLAVNSDGYFPNATLTCLMLNSSSAIRFQRVSKANKYVVRTEQLDDNRQYFLFNSVEEDLATRMDGLALTKTNKPCFNNAGFVAGFEPPKYMAFFSDSIQKNLSELSGDLVSTSIGVNFGKTFLSSVPEEKQEGQTLAFEEVIDIGYGKHGLRPEFVRNFNTDTHTSLLSSIGQEGYEEISSGDFIVVHCVSQKSKKRYNIKLHLKDDTNNGSANSNAVKKISDAKTYFSVLGIQANAPFRQIKIAFRRKALEVHPDNNSDALAEKAFRVVNEAWECLKDSAQRFAYTRLSPCEQLPKNGFKYTAVVAGEPFPDVESFKSVGRKLALCTVLKAATESEFRTTIETSKDEAIDQTLLRKLQSAWDKRSDDGRMRFGTDDWLMVETVRYKKQTVFTNGMFVLTINEATEDHFGKSCDGIHVSLESYDIMDTLDALPDAKDKDSTASCLLSYIRDLQGEATRISSLLDEA